MRGSGQHFFLAVTPSPPRLITTKTPSNTYVDLGLIVADRLLLFTRRTFLVTAFAQLTYAGTMLNERESNAYQIS